MDRSRTEFIGTEIERKTGASPGSDAVMLADLGKFELIFLSIFYMR